MYHNLVILRESALYLVLSLPYTCLDHESIVLLVILVPTVIGFDRTLAFGRFGSSGPRHCLGGGFQRHPRSDVLPVSREILRDSRPHR